MAMPESVPLQPDKDSKSQRKKDMLALQKIGEALLKLNEVQLAKIEMPDELRTAILFAKSLQSHEAKRRQLQYIGKIMREIDPATITHALDKMARVHEMSTAQFHQIEEWRANLIAKGDDAIMSFLNSYPQCDRQQLRQLVRKAQHDIKHEKNTGAEKALFKYIRAIVLE